MLLFLQKKKAFASALWLLLCCAPAHAAAPRVLRVAYQAAPESLDPDNAFLLSGLDALRVIYQGLVAYAPGTITLVPALAETYSVSADRLTYSFHLRAGVRFQDGAAVDASTVAAALRRRADGGFALAYFLAGDTITTPDPMTVVIRLPAPDPAFLHRLASPWGPKIAGPGALVAHAGHDQAATWLDSHSDGTGPYAIASVQPGQRIILQRNPMFAGPKPYFDEIRIFVIPDIGQQALLLQDGSLDVVPHGYPFELLAALPRGLAIDAYQDLGLEMAYVNLSRALKNPDVREAVFAALAPAQWQPEAFGRFAQPATSLYPRPLDMPAQPPRKTVDLARARQVIEAAAPVNIEIGYSIDEGPVQRRAVDLMLASLHAIGVTAIARPVPLGQSMSLRDNLANAPDLWIAQNNPDAADPAALAEPFFTTGASLNLMGYSNPLIDRLIAQAHSLPERTARDAIYQTVDAQLIAQGAFLPLATLQDVIVLRSDLAGIANTPAFPWTLDYELLRRSPP